MQRSAAAMYPRFSSCSQTTSNGSSPARRTSFRPPERIAARKRWAGFFATLGEDVEFHKFEPQEFIAQGDHLVVLISSDATLTRTGRKLTDHVAHVWTFKGGKVARFEIFQDTAAIVAAYS
jgi:ketosteroid isomerase-like protein